MTAPNWPRAAVTPIDVYRSDALQPTALRILETRRRSGLS